MHAVLLAGGRGRRLAPYTHVIPKPLMPVGDRAILEILLRQLRAAGVESATLAVGHQAGLIEAYFGDGSRLGLRLSYSRETEPLGTAGPIAGIEGLPETFFVMNGDLLCDIDFRALWAEHRRSGACLTIGATRRTHRSDRGVLHISADGRLERYEEKPTLEYQVSMGIYVFERTALAGIVPGTRLDLPDLVQQAIARGRPIGTYRHPGLWLDIGNHADYEEANRLFAENPGLFLPDAR